MNSKSELEGGSGNGATIAQERGKSEVMPNPGGVHDESIVDTEPSDDDGALSEEDMGDVDVNNSVSEESPPQR